MPTRTRPKEPPEQSQADELRQLLAEKELTQREAADLAGVTLKAVESWLAAPESPSRRSMPARHLKTIRLLLPRYLAARARRKT